MVAVLVIGNNSVLAAKQDNKGLDPELKKVVDKALELEGAKYKHGEHDPKLGFNCDGFVWYVYKEAIGHLVPMGPANMENFGKKISKSDLRPGDIVAYDLKHAGEATHIALYVGNVKGYDEPQVIHSDDPVKLDSLDKYGNNIRSYRRIYSENNAKVADYRATDWAKVRVSNGTKDYDDRRVVTQYRGGTVVRNAIDYGNFIRFTHNGQTVYAAKSGFTRISKLKPLNKLIPNRIVEEPLIKDRGKALWISRNVNVRNEAGKKIGRLRRGDKVYGLRDGDNYLIDYVYGNKEVVGYVHKAFTSNKNPYAKAYAKSRVNVRDRKTNKVLGQLNRGDYVYGNLRGNYYEFTYNKRPAKVHKNFVTKNVYSGGGYLVRNANLRSVGSGSVVGFQQRGKFNKGRLENGYFYFKYKGSEVRVPESFVKMDKADKMIIKSKVNVRDARGNYLFTKYGGQKIDGVKLGNQYRFYERGKTCFVHQSFVK